MTRSGSRVALLAALSASAVALAGVAPTHADTVRQRVERPAPGAHAVTRLVVDNDGPRVSVAVRHAGRSWDGRTAITLRVPEVEAGFVATVGHGEGRARPTLRFTGGNAWNCQAATLRSPDDARVTQLSVPRHCLRGASSLEVGVRVRAGEGRTDAADAGPVPQQSRPNILMLMVDDMRLDDLQFMPRTQRLIARRGVTFENGMAPYPLCCPARASVLTGLYTHNHRVFSHLEPYGFNKLDDSSTIATWLDDAGYETSYVGKYLNGYGHQPAPGETTGRSVRYVPPGWDDWRASIDGGLPDDHPKRGSTYNFWNTTLSNDGRGFVSGKGTYSTNLIGRIGRQQMTRSAKRQAPFFSYISFVAPHFGTPREPDDPGTITDDSGNERAFSTVARPKRVRGMFDSVITEAPGVSWDDPDDSDRPEEMAAAPPLNQAEIDGLLAVHRQRAESLAVVDEEVAKILRALERTGEREETMVVFTSDNGYFLGEHGVRQGKTLPYEPSLRVPLLVSGPGIPAGELRSDPFLSIDFAPTFAELADVRPPYDVDGASLLTSARMGDQGWNRAVLTETGPASTVRQTDETGAPLLEGGQPADLRFVLGIRTPRYLYTDRATGHEGLYDVVRDPDQYVNLIDRPAKALVVEEMRATLRRVRACDGVQCRAPLPAILR